MEIPCPLCECMLSIFSMVQRQLSKKCKGIQNKEKNTKNGTPTLKNITKKKWGKNKEKKKMDEFIHP